MRPLAALGNVNVDLIMGQVTPWPRPGTEIVVDHDALRAGGAAGNAALAWAGLGVPFKIASNIGEDAFGRWLAQAFAPHSAAWPIAATGTTISVGLTHPGDERTFVTTRGHLPVLSWPQARAQLEGLEGGLLLVCGSFLTHRLTGDYPALFSWAEERGVEVALDPGWPIAGWDGGQRRRTVDWLGKTRHLLVNEVEALALSERRDVSEALSALARMMPTGATVVVKAGGNGAHGWRDGRAVRVRAPEVRVLDTIGAGDVFNAGYLLAAAGNASLADALEAGVTLASRAIATDPRVYDWPIVLRRTA